MFYDRLSGVSSLILEGHLQFLDGIQRKSQRHFGFLMGFETSLGSLPPCDLL